MIDIVRDLSDVYGLTVYADRIWTGDGCMGLGMVFTGNSMRDTGAKVGGTEARAQSKV